LFLTNDFCETSFSQISFFFRLWQLLIIDANCTRNQKVSRVTNSRNAIRSFCSQFKFPVRAKLSHSKVAVSILPAIRDFLQSFLHLIFIYRVISELIDYGSKKLFGDWYNEKKITIYYRLNTLKFEIKIIFS